VRLPKGVSTQIITGYLVRAHGHAFVLPLDRVRETFKVLPADLNPIAGGGRVVRRGEQVLPLLSLPRVFGSPAELVPAAGGPVVVAMVRRRALALAVDAVLGVQKVVLRPLQGLPEDGLLFTAGALLGDGTVALVLDLDRLQPGMD
jgi:two-component system chemotaxis sensor kinase CheA